MWWACPNCKRKVDFQDQMEFMFDENNEADFDPKRGVYFHTIMCECDSSWTISISGVNKNYDKEIRKKIFSKIKWAVSLLILI